nr:transposase [Enterocloster clostridioformis]
MFHYQRHEDHKTITECVPVTHFIKHLIVHIPGKNFKMVRYYGIYAKHHRHFYVGFRSLPQKNCTI